MKVAIVGIGHVAQHQMNAIGQLNGAVELVGAYDEDAGARHKRDLPCHFHGTLADLIEKSPADLVIVSTSNSDHFATASKLLAAGRAVMVEKPACETRADLNRLVKIARAGKIFFHTALHAAFANDLLWWVENRATLSHRFGPLERFDMGFYDPYIERDGMVIESARGLGGSWYDSGINALSVLGRIADPASIRVTGAEMFSSPHIACDQINGSARLRCQVDGETVSGEIRTDWTLGLNRKTSILSYRDATVILDHSSEKVAIREGDGQPEIVSFQNGLPRLTNHYVGVFRDLSASLARRSDNTEFSLQLHELLFAAVQQGGDRQQNPFQARAAS